MVCVLVYNTAYKRMTGNAYVERGLVLLSGNIGDRPWCPARIQLRYACTIANVSIRDSGIETPSVRVNGRLRR